jgi:6-phosphogluconolactonase (cycloisomerase 2 family)
MRIEMNKLTLSSVCIATALMLAACGGGGSSAPTVINANVYTENAYVAGAAGAVNQYSVNASGGLVALTTASVTAGTNAVSSVVVTPNKLYAYATNTLDNKIYVFTIGADGSLTAASSMTTPLPVHAVVDASGAFLYVSNGGTNATISEFSINQATGALTAITPVISTTGCGATPYPAGLAINASALYFVTPSTVCAFAIGSATTAGTIGTPVTPLAALSIKAVGTATNKWLTLGSKGLYVSDGSNIYEVSKSNALPTPTIVSNATPPVTTNGTLNAATVTTYALAGVGNVPVSSVDLYAPAASTVAQYTLSTTTGVPTALSTPTVASSTGALSFVAIDNTSAYLYAAGATGVSQYTISASATATSNGALVPNATPMVAGPAWPTYITFR